MASVTERYNSKLKHEILKAVYEENIERASRRPGVRNIVRAESPAPTPRLAQRKRSLWQIALVGLIAAGIALGWRWLPSASPLRIAALGTTDGSVPELINHSHAEPSDTIGGLGVGPFERLEAFAQLPLARTTDMPLTTMINTQRNASSGASTLDLSQVDISVVASPILDTFNQLDYQPADYRRFLSNQEIDLAELFGLSIKTIVIDPGHGGSDPGATGLSGLREKDVTLDISKRLSNRLKRYGRLQTLLTREKDRKVSLKERVQFANQHKADLFLSIHVNYLIGGPETVIETYYFGPHSDQQSLRLAEAENQDSEFSLGNFKDMIQRIGYQFKHRESRVFAASIQRNLFRNLQRSNRELINVGIKTAPFVVLLGADMPSVLAEVTCLNNEREEQRLTTPGYREEIARYLEEGIVEYLEINQPNIDTMLGAKHDASRENSG